MYKRTSTLLLLAAMACGSALAAEPIPTCSQDPGGASNGRRMEMMQAMMEPVVRHQQAVHDAEER